tara:strand:- start:1982 stop:3001 length:1020 start_codon:yes stop_codon:yes gene_type:complete
MDILILGSTSNICAKRVFDNLNNLHSKINTIYCYDMKNMSELKFHKYIKTNVKIQNKNMILNKIKYIYGNFNLTEYEKKIKNILHQKLIIYVSIPPFCYECIVQFFKDNNNYNKLILEKPLALDYNNYCILKPLFTENVYVIDHFLYKRDIKRVIEYYKTREINKIKIKFLYENDVEDRLGYFDNVGFFIDMFQSHYLSILYYLIGIDKIEKLLKMDINTNIRKQYNNYGGKNNIDTYFYVELKDDKHTYIFEGGKAMVKEEKILEINDLTYTINNYNDEYELYFNDLIDENVNESMIKYHDIFWKITEYINNNKKNNISFYDKNKPMNKIINVIKEYC